ncbi:MAG: ArsR/SmtB family transcription factor [Candidatus Njordarchaeales archaeon]
MKIDVVEVVKKKFGDKCSGEIYNYLKDLVLKKPDDKLIDELMLIKKLFSNRIRVLILILLSQAALPVCALTSILNVDQTLVSHNLSVLKKLGITREERVGKYRVYSLNKKKLKRILQTAISTILA